MLHSLSTKGPANPLEFERPRKPSCASCEWSDEHTSLLSENDKNIASLDGGLVESSSGIVKRKGIVKALQEDFYDGILYTFTFEPFRWVTLLYVCAWLNVQMVQNNMILYLKYVSKMGDEFQTVLLCLLLTTFASTPLLGFWVKNIGKPATFIFGMGILIPIELALYMGIENRGAMYVLASLSGVGVSTAYLLPSVMLPDVIDMAERETGIRREGSFYSFFVFAQKFGSGIALSFSNVLLGFGGFVTGSEIQPISVLSMLCRLLGLFPGYSSGFEYAMPLEVLSVRETKSSKVGAFIEKGQAIVAHLDPPRNCTFLLRINALKKQGAVVGFCRARTSKSVRSVLSGIVECQRGE